MNPLPVLKHPSAYLPLVVEHSDGTSHRFDPERLDRRLKLAECVSTPFHSRRRPVA